MYVVVINLDEDHDRLLHFQSTMDRLAVPFHRWSATPGTELDDTRFGMEPIGHGIYIKDFRHWSKNEAACGVSHIKVLQHIVRERIPWAIVMEDDAMLQRPLPLDSASWELPEDADIVLLNDRAAPGAVRKAGVPSLTRTSVVVQARKDIWYQCVAQRSYSRFSILCASR